MEVPTTYHRPVQNSRWNQGQNTQNNRNGRGERVDRIYRGGQPYNTGRNQNNRPPLNNKARGGKVNQKCIAFNQQITSAKSIDEIITISKSNLSDFDHVNIATAIHSIAKYSKTAKLTSEQKEYMLLLANATLSKMQYFKSREIANIAWAFATLDITNEKLFNALADSALSKIDRKSVV